MNLKGRSSNQSKRSKTNGIIKPNSSPDIFNGQTNDILLTDTSPNRNLNQSSNKEFTSNEELKIINSKKTNKSNEDKLKPNHSNSHHVITNDRDSPGLLSKNSMNLLLNGNENDSASSNEDQTNSNEFKETIYSEEEEIGINQTQKTNETKPKSSSLGTRFNKLIKLNSPFKSKSNGNKDTSKKKISFNFKKILNSDDTSQPDSTILRDINSNNITNDAENDAETEFYISKSVNNKKPSSTKEINGDLDYLDGDDISVNDITDTHYHKIEKSSARIFNEASDVTKSLKSVKAGNGSLNQKSSSKRTKSNADSINFKPI